MSISTSIYLYLYLYLYLSASAPNNNLHPSSFGCPFPITRFPRGKDLIRRSRLRPQPGTPSLHVLLLYGERPEPVNVEILG